MQTRDVIRRLVREHPLLEGLSEPERSFVEDIGISATVKPRDYFIREGEATPISISSTPAGASVCFGFSYLRYRKLTGVTIVHDITGVAGHDLTMMASI